MESAVDQSLPKPSREVKNPSGRPLVTTHISQQESSDFDFELYPVSIKILRERRISLQSKRGLRREISSFSLGSKKRLRFTASNASPPLISHFLMTYHQRCPDGREVKSDLNSFLTSLRRANLNVGYLWILEFQKRGVPHIHLWLTSEVSYSLHQFLAGRWNAIAEPGSSEHLRFHLHEKNFIAWEMRSARYLCKYLDKSRQKEIPVGFLGVGRFWGSSRGLVSVPSIVSDLELSDSFSLVTKKAAKQILRALCKSQERKIRNKKWKNQARRFGNYTWMEGRGAFDKILSYYQGRKDQCSFGKMK